MIQNEIVNQKSTPVPKNKPIRTVLDRIKSRSWSDVNKDLSPPNLPPAYEKSSRSQDIGASPCSPYKHETEKRVGNEFRHNSIYSDPKDQYWFEYHKGGSAIKITKTKRDWARSQKQIEARRGKITSFSRKARQRLLWLCACLNQALIQHMPKFATLTYPDAVVLERTETGDIREIKVEDIDKDTYKRHIKNFRASLMRKYPDCFVIARIEQMDRKSGSARGELVNHWHLAIFNLGFIDYEWVSKTWNRILTLGMDKEHLKAGTQCENARDWGAVGSYFSKTLAYVGKEADEDVEFMAKQRDKWVGRHYAIWNKEEMQKHINRVVGVFTDKQFHSMRRQLYSLYRGMRRQRLIDDLGRLETNTIPDEITGKLRWNPKFMEMRQRAKRKQERDERMKQFNRQMVGFKKWKRARNFLGGSLMGFIPDELFVRMLMSLGKELNWDEE